MRRQCCREGIDTVAEKCGLDKITVDRIKDVAAFCRSEAEKGNEQICHLPTTAAAALMHEKDPEIKQKAIQHVANRLNRKTPTGGQYKKRITERDVKKVLRGLKREKQNQGRAPAPLPEGLFEVILADPPWEYEFSETDSRALENHYPTMVLDQIKAIKVPATDNSLLFLWATAPKLTEALEVMQAWGFTYRTCAIWDKERKGMGYWFRIQHELLLVGMKGYFPTPPPEARFDSIIRSPRQGHSEKPLVVYEMIEKMFPAARKVELFARAKRDGWSAWGNEIVP